MKTRKCIFRERVKEGGLRDRGYDSMKGCDLLRNLKEVRILGLLEFRPARACVARSLNRIGLKLSEPLLSDITEHRIRNTGMITCIDHTPHRYVNGWLPGLRFGITITLV